MQVYHNLPTRILLICLLPASLFLASSCVEEEDEFSPSFSKRTKSLTNGKWQLTGFTTKDTLDLAEANERGGIDEVRTNDMFELYYLTEDGGNDLGAQTDTNEPSYYLLSRDADVRRPDAEANAEDVLLTLIAKNEGSGPDQEGQLFLTAASAAESLNPTFPDVEQGSRFNAQNINGAPDTKFSKDNSLDFGALVAKEIKNLPSPDQSSVAIDEGDILVFETARYKGLIEIDDLDQAQAPFFPNDPSVDSSGEGAIEFNLKFFDKTAESCFADDVWDFRTSNKLTMDFGRNFCPLFPERVQQFTWEWLNDQSEILLTNPNFSGERYQVQTLSENELKLQGQTTIFGGKVQATLNFSKQ